MNKGIVILLLSFFAANVLFAQDNGSDFFKHLTEKKEGRGEVTIVQDYSLQVLVNKHAAINKKNDGKCPGYRLKIFSNIGGEAKKEGQKVRADFKEKYKEKDIEAYLSYKEPNFIVVAGDFRTKSEAFKLLKEISADYPNAFIIEDMIALPAIK